MSMPPRCPAARCAATSRVAASIWPVGSLLALLAAGPLVQAEIPLLAGGAVTVLRTADGIDTVRAPAQAGSVRRFAPVWREAGERLH